MVGSGVELLIFWKQPMGFEMYSEILKAILTTLGGASVIVFGFAHFLGKAWIDRIAKQTMAKYDKELAILKSQHELVFQEFKQKAEFELKDLEHFGGISKDVYQEFFKSRISTYIKLLEIKNAYISDMREEFITEETESWGTAYHSIYVRFKKVITEQQLYISNELDKVFHELRMKACEYIKEADMAEAYAMGAGSKHPEEASEDALNKLVSETSNLMNKVIKQIDADVSKLRSRIDLDKAN